MRNLHGKKNYLCHTHNHSNTDTSSGANTRKGSQSSQVQSESMVEAMRIYEHGTKKIPKNDFEKDFSKLMKNSVFGKTMENVWKYRQHQIYDNWKVV